jgi:hypothetical protein
MGAKLGLSHLEKNIEVFEGRFLKSIFEPKRGEVAGG